MGHLAYMDIGTYGQIWTQDTGTGGHIGHLGTLALDRHNITDTYMHNTSTH